MTSIPEAWKIASQKCQTLIQRAQREQPPDSPLFQALEGLRLAVAHETATVPTVALRNAETAFDRARDAAAMLTIRARQQFAAGSTGYDLMNDLVAAIIERVDLSPLGQGWRPLDPADSQDLVAR